MLLFTLDFLTVLILFSRYLLGYHFGLSYVTSEHSQGFDLKHVQFIS